MLSVSREKSSGQIVVTTSGVLDENAVNGVLSAVALAPDEAAIVIDLSQAQSPSPHSLRCLAAGLSHHAGPVAIRGPSWVQALRSSR